MRFWILDNPQGVIIPQLEPVVEPLLCFPLFFSIFPVYFLTSSFSLSILSLSPFPFSLLLPFIGFDKTTILSHFLCSRTFIIAYLRTYVMHLHYLHCSPNIFKHLAISYIQTRGPSDLWTCLFIQVAHPESPPLLVPLNFSMSHLLLSLQTQVLNLWLKWPLINDAYTKASDIYFEIILP
jgi:hypothetical protein